MLPGFLSDEHTSPEKSLRTYQCGQSQKIIRTKTHDWTCFADEAFIAADAKGRSQHLRNPFRTRRFGSLTIAWVAGMPIVHPKAALNMLVKSAAIETSRTKPDAVICALASGEPSPRDCLTRLQGVATGWSRKLLLP